MDANSTVRRFRRLRLPVLLAVLALGVGASAGPTTAARSAEPAFACPDPPNGWKTTSGNPNFWGPDENPGADTERIGCNYESPSGQFFGVAVIYALPNDLNPFNDFTFGCGSNGDKPWDAKTRTFGVVSRDRWVYGNFADPDNVLRAADVLPFEALTRSLLGQVRDFAHTCSLQVKPTQAVSGWLFDFVADLGSKGVTVSGGIGTHTSQHTAGIAAFAIPDGSFTTTGAAAGPKVTGLKAPDVPLTVVVAGKRHHLVLRFAKGLDFTYAVTAADPGKARAVLRASVTVVRSNVPGCAPGETGTMELGVYPSTLGLDLCASVLGKLRTQSAHVTLISS